MRYLFANFSLDTDRRELHRDGDLIAIEPKVFDVLARLIASRDRVVSKDELIAAIWSNRVVSDSTLTTSINAVRRVVGDSGKTQGLIKTLPRKGFRFVGEVQEDGPVADAAANPSKPGLALLARPSIAVLPFQNMSGDPDQEHFVDGVTEDIIIELGRFRWLFVVARNSSFAYKGQAIDVRRIAQELGVRYVLEGSIRRAGNRIRVTSQLIDGVTGSHVWAERYDHASKDVFEVQEKLTRAIVSALVPQLDIAETSRSLRSQPTDIALAELIFRGFREVSEGYLKVDGVLLDAAIETAKKALALDPANAHPWSIICAALSARLHLGQATDIERIRSEAFAAGTRAIEADPQSSNAFVVRGTFQCENGRFVAGLKDLRHARTLNPNDTLAMYRLGQFEALNGNPSGGLELIRRAMRLSPKDFFRPAMHTSLSLACVIGRRYAEGVEAALVAANEMPTLAPAYAVLALNQVGLAEIPQARAAIDKLRQIAPGYLDFKLEAGWPCQTAEDAQRLKLFIRIAAGIDDPVAAKAVA